MLLLSDYGTVRYINPSAWSLSPVRSFIHCFFLHFPYFRSFSLIDQDIMFKVEAVIKSN